MHWSFIPRPGRKRAEILHELRGLTSSCQAHPRQSVLAFGLPAIDASLPQGGLSLAAMHEIAPQTDADRAAAFGFIAALFGRLPRRGPVIFVTGPTDGCLHGHGLNGLGLDPSRVILVQAADDVQTLWATEEALRSGLPAGVAGMAGAKLDLLAGQRLSLAAGASGIPLVLLRPPGLPGINVAMTRWRIGSASCRRDRFGLATHWRWQARLERCRNGRTGEWLLEFDHAAYRFSLPAAMAHSAIPRRAGTSSFAANARRS